MLNRNANKRLRQYMYKVYL